MYDYCALSSEKRKQLLNIFSSILKPDGAVLLDVCSLNTFNEINEQSVYENNLQNGFWSANNYYGFQNTFKYIEEKVILDKYTIIEKDNIYTIYNWMQYFDLDMIKKEFLDNGFKITQYFSDVSGTEFCNTCKEFAVVGNKIL